MGGDLPPGSVLNGTVLLCYLALMGSDCSDLNFLLNFKNIFINNGREEMVI